MGKGSAAGAAKRSMAMKGRAKPMPPLPTSTSGLPPMAASPGPVTRGAYGKALQGQRKGSPSKTPKKGK